VGGERSGRILDSLEHSGERASVELQLVLRRIATARHLERDTAQEASQDALAQLWARRRSVREPEAFAVALFLRRLCDQRRRDRRARRREVDLDPGELPEASPGTAELDAWLREGLARLDRRSADLLWAKHLEGRTDAEIASRFGLSARSVAKTVSRAEARYRRLLTRN
jgi:RNA polymerase sigma factor (sigma-70 family)